MRHASRVKRHSSRVMRLASRVTRHPSPITHHPLPFTHHHSSGWLRRSLPKDRLGPYVFTPSPSVFLYHPPRLPPVHFCNTLRRHRPHVQPAGGRSHLEYARGCGAAESVAEQQARATVTCRSPPPSLIALVAHKHSHPPPPPPPRENLLVTSVARIKVSYNPPHALPSSLPPPLPPTSTFPHHFKTTPA